MVNNNEEIVNKIINNSVNDSTIFLLFSNLFNEVFDEIFPQDSTIVNISLKDIASNKEHLKMQIFEKLKSLISSFDINSMESMRKIIRQILSETKNNLQQSQDKLLQDKSLQGGRKTPARKTSTRKVGKKRNNGM